jgi:hypothetical protein
MARYHGHAGAPRMDNLSIPGRPRRSELQSAGYDKLSDRSGYYRNTAANG